MPEFVPDQFVVLYGIKSLAIKVIAYLLTYRFLPLTASFLEELVELATADSLTY